MPKYISGRYKKTPQSALTADRYRYLSPGDAEPNLGDTPTSQGSPDLPVGQQYIVVSFIDRPGERFWIPNQGGIIPGSLSIFEEGTLVGGLSSTTQLNFIGQSITAVGVGTGTNNAGVAVTITVAPPGNENEVLFVGTGGTDFATDTRFTFDDGLFTAGDRIIVGTGGTVITTTGIGSVGIGTTNPTQKLHLDGNFRITGTIYDSLNQPGSQGDLIVKTATGGLEWVEQQSITAGAGGTIGQIQFHAATGLVDGANNFYYDFNNNRVGIGSTQPTQLLDVLGVSTFSGGVFVDTLNVSGITTFKNKVHFLDDDILHFGGAEGDVGDLQIYHNGTHSYIKEEGTGELRLGSNNAVRITKHDSETLATFTVDGAVDLYYDNSKKFETTEYGVSVTGGLSVSGISSLGNVEIGSNTISTKAGTGNLIIDSDASVNIQDPLIVSGETESETKDSGSLVVEGGIGVEKSVNIGKNLKVTGITTLGSTDANTGFTTTVGDLYVGGDLYINDDISFDNLQANTGTFSDSLKVTGIATIHELYVGAAGTIGITTILDEDNMSSNSDTALATQQSIKAYVDNEIGAIDLDFSGDTGSGSVDLDDQTFAISGTTNEIETSAENQTLTIGLPDNVTVSGNLTVNGNTTLGNDVNSDTVTFGSTISSAFIPDTDNSYNIGSTDYKWGTVYATTFNGAFQGTADNADKLTNARTFTLGQGEDDDILQVQKTFDGSADVGFALTLKDVGPGEGTYGGENTKVLSLTLDAKGRVTGVTSTSIDFGNANVATADSLTDSRNIAATGDITWNVDFKGHENVTATATLANTDVSAGDYGSGTQVGTFSVDSKGRLTAASNVDINFADATVDKAGYADNAGIATNLKDGQAYNIPYQSGASETSFITNGSDGQLLQFNDNAAPSWVSAADLTAGTASKANNLAGGAAGSIPYQSGVDATSFLAEPNADDKILGYNNSTNAPVWIDASSVGTDTNTFAGLTDTAESLGSAGQLVAVNSAGDTLEFIDAASVGTDTNTIYDLIGGGTNGTDFGTGTGTITLRADSDSNTDDTVTITAGTNIKINGTSTTGFTITAKDTNDNDNTTYLLKATKDSDGGDTGTDADPYLFLDASGSGTDDSVQLVGSGSVTVSRTNEGAITISGTDSNTNTFVGLTDTAEELGSAGQLVAVNSAGDTLEFIDAGGVGTDTNTFAGLTDTAESLGSAGQLVAVNSAGDTLEFIDASTVGTDTNAFKDLTDTPESLGSAGQLVAVNSAGNELEFIDASTVGTDTNTFAGLTDTAESLGSAGQLVAVNSAGNKLEFINASTVGTDTDTFIGLTDVHPTSLIDQENKLVTVASFSDGEGGTVNKLTFIDASSVGTDTNTFAGLIDTAEELGSAGQLVAVNSAGDKLEFIDASSVGTDTNTFAGLTDTPSSLSQQGNKLVAVNSAGNALEFIDAGGVGTDTNTFLGLTDTPANYTDKAGKIVQVNNAGDGLVFTNPENLSTTGTTYTLPTTGDNNSVTITLTGSDSTTDPVTITAGDGISFSSITESGFTITSTAVGGSEEPVGTIVAWGGSTTNIPSEYILCNGASLDRDEYADLFDALGTVHGSIDSDSFNIPDLRNQFIVGAKGGSGADNTYPGLAVGATGGRADAILPQHHHDIDDPGHNHNITAARVTGDTESGNGDEEAQNEEFETSDATTGITVDNVDDDETNAIVVNNQATINIANLPPYYALCFIIKTTASQSGSGSSGAGFVDKIEEGDTKAEVIDTGSESKFTVEIDSAEKFSVDIGGPKIHRQDSSNEGGSLIFNRAADDVAAFEIDAYGSSNTDSGRLRIVDSIAGVERLTIGSAGQIGLGGENYGVPGQVLTSNGSGSAPTWENSGGSSKVAILSDVKTAGTNGGDFDSGAWRNRELNTELDPESFVTFSSSNNYFELGEGSYRISWSAPAHAVDKHQTRLTYANNTGFSNSSKVYGTSEACFDPILEGNNNIQTRSFGETIITITETTYFKIQHRCQDSKNGSGFGLGADFSGNDVIYTQVIIQDLNSGGGSGSGSGSGFVLLDRKSATGTSVEFTGIPANVLEMTLMFEGVSGDTATDFDVQLGTSSGYITSNYNSSSEKANGDNSSNSTSSFVIRNDKASGSFQGSMIINKSSSNSYSEIGQFKTSSTNAMDCYGTLSSVSGVVDRLKVSISNGNFDTSGLIGLSYKTSGSGGSGGSVLETPKSAATGNSNPIEFTGIPVNAQEITLMFNGVSLSGDNEYLVQLGTVDGYVETGYTSMSQDEGGTNPSDSDEGFIIIGSASHAIIGKFDITKFSDTAYIFEGQARKNTTGGLQAYGSLNSVNGTITKLRIKPTSNNNFDAGSINISYKTA
jgi:microcystin-dependent protein